MTGKTVLRGRLLREMVIASRFTLVGITATGVHVLILWLLLTQTAFPTLVANLFAFLAAFGFSFIGNYVWTFSAPGDPYRAVRRFLLISGGAFAANTLLLAGLLASKWLEPIHAAMVSAMLIPGITFLASRVWGFNYIRRP
jgi:putative flippase GtrA